ncbi:MAG: sigma-70 family RNA polymerase sigma factor [Planctomycetota bacterium]|nr:MAG: sigma-70 family RNA polymerase sigma factor [Planctomycetota bacterium]
MSHEPPAGEDSSSDSHPIDLTALAPKIYKRLKRIAEHYMRHERRDHTLDPSALVHEAYLRLAGQKEKKWENQAHFFAAAAQAMRFILVDYAKTRMRKKRRGQRSRVPLSETLVSEEAQSLDPIALDDALTELASQRPEQARVIELRYFVGLTIAETASVMGISTATVEREWRRAREWLWERLTGEPPPGAP